MGPSAPPMLATAAAAPGSSPNRQMPATRVTNVPSSAKMAMIMELQGLASR